MTFVCEEGGEICWELREKLTETIRVDQIKLNGRDLFARVQDAPDLEQKKGHFWRAVDALKLQGKEDEHFILAPRALGIHAATSMELLGAVSPQGYVWSDEVVKGTLPTINLVELKKATLQRWRRQ